MQSTVKPCSPIWVDPQKLFTKDFVWGGQEDYWKATKKPWITLSTTGFHIYSVAQQSFMKVE